MCEWQRCPLATCWLWRRGTNDIPPPCPTASEISIWQGAIFVIGIIIGVIIFIIIIVKTWNIRTCWTACPFTLVTCHSLFIINCSSTNFTTSDGFRLTWSYSHLGPAMPVGSINLNRLQQQIINMKHYENVPFTFLYGQSCWSSEGWRDALQLWHGASNVARHWGGWWTCASARAQSCSKVVMIDSLWWLLWLLWLWCGWTCTTARGAKSCPEADKHDNML